MPRTCDCAGPCGPSEDDEGDGVSRRGFLTLLGTGVLAAAAPGAAIADTPDPAAALTEWKRGLAAPGETRRYRSDRHTDARFPLGGIGTGGFELGVDGRCTTWQLWNTLRDGFVPLLFGVRAGGAAKILQTTGGPVGLPAVAGIEMTGDYPLATLRYEAADLPVRLSLTAFSPFAPRDSELSSLPAACFLFRIENPTDWPQTVSLGAFLQNPVGYDALGGSDGAERWDAAHPNYGGNVNTPLTGRGYAGIGFTARGSDPASLGGHALTVYTTRDPAALSTYPVDHAPGFHVRSLGELPGADARDGIIIWIEDAPRDIDQAVLRKVREAVNAGATLVWAGKESPLLDLAARYHGNGTVAPDILFEDFENGYGTWTAQGGDAFGTVPASGTLPNQQVVSGFLGKGLVNSFLNGDGATGRLVSPSFTITRRYIRFLVGGGASPQTQVRLIVDGQAVRRQSGRDQELLFPAVWDVAEFSGKTAHIEIADEATGPWGHILADQFAFSDLPVSAESLALAAELLPVTLPAAAPDAPPRDHAALFAQATVPASATRPVVGAARFVARPLGKGRTVLASGPLLAADQATLFGSRQRAFAALAELAGVPYQPPTGVPAHAPGFGSLALAVLGGERRSVHPAFTDWSAAWAAFAKEGGFPGAQKPSPMPSPPGRTVNGAVAATVSVPPGGAAEIPFILTWHFPNRYNLHGEAVGNRYTAHGTDAAAVLRDIAPRFAALRERTERFRTVFYDSSLPYWLLDGVTSQISTIRHPGVVFRIGNGDIYGWEGANGCCAPTCTHVWGYEQTLAYLFPDLEREMRRIDFYHQQNPDGGINNRTEVPSPPGRPTGEHPFTDGHASSILKLYREARNQTDPAYLKGYWRRVHAAVDYLIARDAATSPDGKPDGTLSDDQWNTYDNAIHGVNTFIGAYYLAALRAGEEMARTVGDTTSADRFRAVFELGRKNLVALCWNGEYFEQHLPDYAKRSGEYGPGCLSDQLLGQWWAHQLGLGYLLPPEMVRSALQAVFRHNWRTDFTGFRHNWRKFAGGTDKGLLICTWPRGGRPANTIPYVDEVWTGVEYQVAAHLAYEGMHEEAYCVAKGARDRYDGIPRAPIVRSPWNEIECGGHYARAMSSWSLLLALSGWDYDGPSRTLRLTVPSERSPFRAFFSGPQGYGTLTHEFGTGGKLQRTTLHVAEGHFDIATMRLLGAGGASIRKAERVAGSKRSSLTGRIDRADGTPRLRFAETGERISVGQSLVVSCA